MNRHLYARLALTNLKNNRAVYFPYLLACSAIVGMYYILDSTVLNLIASPFTGAAILSSVIRMSTIILAIVSVLIIFYTNSFLIKRRQRELGLYSVLGMEKRHIARVFFWETLFSGAFCILAGLVAGVLFSRLVHLLLLRILQLPSVLVFAVPPASLLHTAGLFAVNFLLVLGYNLRRVQLSNPVALLQSHRLGEREPRSKAFITLLGVLALGCGYALALCAKTPSDALTVFFPAVLLVIAGTYLLFTSGSISLLKLLRRHKGFYYRPKNFIAVSGMMYRMKQNAVGLANICILSTCVLVTLSSTVSLMMGEEDILTHNYPRDLRITMEEQVDVEGWLGPQLEELAAGYQVTFSQPEEYRFLSLPCQLRGNVLSLRDDSILVEGTLCQIQLLPLEDYNRIAHQNRTLQPGEVLALGDGSTLSALGLGSSAGTQLVLNGATLTLRGVEVLPDGIFLSDVDYQLVLVADGMELLEQQRDLLQATGSKADIRRQLSLNLEGEEQDKLAFARALWDDIIPRLLPDYFRLADRYTAEEDFLLLYGGLFFVGVFFVALFLIATVLIIYYKQISEGFDDRERFEIMQKVGLSHREVRQVIQKQILIVFFLPLVMAVIHIGVAFPVLCKLMAMFMMTNTTLFLACTGFSVLGFGVFYFVVYQLTSKSYYRLVVQRR